MRRPSSRQAGNVGFIVIVLLILAGIGYFVWSSRNSTAADAQRFAREVIDRVAVQHDLKYLNSIIAPSARMEFTPGVADDEMQHFIALGKPEPGYNITGKVDFENYFFKPHGRMSAILTFPDRHVTISVDIVQPEGEWRIKGLYMTWEKPPEG